MRYILIVVLCLIGFSSCKPTDPIMNAAELFYEKGLISTSGIELLREEYNHNGKLERGMVISVAMGGGLNGYTAYPPLRANPADFEPAPGQENIILPENEEILQFLLIPNSLRLLK